MRAEYAPIRYPRMAMPLSSGGVQMTVIALALGISLSCVGGAGTCDSGKNQLLRLVIFQLKRVCTYVDILLVI